MTYKPVDTAITMIVGPLIDDTDFKSLEEAIAYNAAGMDISLIVEKTDGTNTVTAITLTTGGTSDWTHKDGGYYEIEITAAQNIEEGIGYIRGICDGVLPFESIHYNIVKANIYDSWVKGTDILQTDIIQLGGVTQSATDLKDFADAGYDPATNKINGVKLTDTTTTNTDMVGTNGANTTTPPTVIQIRQEMDSNSVDLNSILEDTNELQLNQGNWVTATGFSTHSAANVWSVGTRSLTDKSGFGLSTASINLIWDDLLTGITQVGSIGKLIADNLNATITSRAVSNEYDTQMGYIPSNLNEVPTATELNTAHGSGNWITATGFSTHSAADIWSVSTRVLTDKSGFALSAAGANLILKDSTFALAIADAIWDEILTGTTHNITTSAGKRIREIGAFAIHSGTAQTGNIHSITLAATAASDDGIYNRNLIVITDNTGVGQTRTIVDYNGTTKVAVIDRDWRVSPDATTTYQITADNTPLVVDQGVAQGGTSTTITLRAYASSINDTYLCNVIAIIAGTGRGQARLVGSYNGTTKVVTICGDNWIITPDTTSIYVLMPYGTTCTSCIGTYARGQINTECDTALTDYNPPTRTEATTDKDAIITEVNANETKIDMVNTIVDAIKAQTDNLPSGITKNEALPKFDFLMVLSSDHVSAATGKTITGEISKDGGAFTAITNTITEVSSGMYTIANGFTATEMNANVISLKFDAADCDTRIISIITS